MIADVQDVVFLIGGDKVLDDVSIKIEKGSFFTLFGLDDAGKTTLLNLLCGFCRPDEGYVEVCGQDPSSGVINGRGLRFVPDDIIWEDFLTGRAYLDFCRQNSTYYKVELEQELCRIFQLPLDRKLTTLTYEENKMLQIAGAVSAMPEMLVLDEPKNFLGRNTYRKLLDCLEWLCKKGMTILLAAEAYADVRSYCTHYAYLKEGKIVAAAKVPIPDYRKKMVIVDKREDLAEQETKKRAILSDAMEKCIAIRRDRMYYLYTGDCRQLCDVIMQSGCKDLIIEELTLEEELDQDYTRWT